MNKNYWDHMYTSTPLENVPWQNTQDDWFKLLLVDGTITGDSALDLGCGTGVKSIQLVGAGFSRVVGIDISAKAIEYAHNNLKQHSLHGEIEFMCHYATDLALLGGETFDFVLDWANLHGLPESRHETYASQIAQHTTVGSRFLLRAFKQPNDTSKDHFITEKDGFESKITLFSRQRVEQLFGVSFSIIAENESKPRTHGDLLFGEYLMIRG